LWHLRPSVKAALFLLSNEESRSDYGDFYLAAVISATLLTSHTKRKKRNGTKIHHAAKMEKEANAC